MSPYPGGQGRYLPMLYGYIKFEITQIIWEAESALEKILCLVLRLHSNQIIAVSSLEFRRNYYKTLSQYPFWHIMN